IGLCFPRRTEAMFEAIRPRVRPAASTRNHLRSISDSRGTTVRILCVSPPLELKFGRGSAAGWPEGPAEKRRSPSKAPNYMQLGGGVSTSGWVLRGARITVCKYAAYRSPSAGPEGLMGGPPPRLPSPAFQAEPAEAP